MIERFSMLLIGLSWGWQALLLIVVWQRSKESQARKREAWFVSAVAVFVVGLGIASLLAT